MSEAFDLFSEVLSRFPDPQHVATLARLFKNLEVDKQTGCWLWTGCCSHYGYGVIKVFPKTLRVHRIAYEILVGPVANGKMLDHTCHKPDICDGGPNCIHRRCFNPEHLEQVDNLTNYRRGCGNKASIEWRRQVTHCPKGHEYNFENTYISRKGSRCCRESQRLKQAEIRHRRKEQTAA